MSSGMNNTSCEQCVGMEKCLCRKNHYDTQFMKATENQHDIGAATDKVGLKIKELSVTIDLVIDPSIDVDTYKRVSARMDSYIEEAQEMLSKALESELNR